MDRGRHKVNVEHKPLMGFPRKHELDLSRIEVTSDFENKPCYPEVMKLAGTGDAGKFH
jgi:hypothetical protein